MIFLLLRAFEYYFNMTSSFENLNRVELLRKRETLYYYIEKINKELEKRDAKETINDRLDRDLKEIEKANTNPVALAFKKMMSKTEKEEKPIEKIVEKETKKIKIKKKKEDIEIKETKENIKKKKPTIAIIKKGLDNKKIKYKKSSKKDELMEIVRKNNLVRYVESLC